MDFKDALLLFYIIIVATYFDTLFSCDLQRLFRESMVAKHVLAFISAFFLITVVDRSNDVKTVGEMLRTTLIVYALYILSTKSKAIFVLPLILVLFVDQLLRVQHDVIERKSAEVESTMGARVTWARQMAWIRKTREVLTWVVLALIASGAVHYYVRARREYKTAFNHHTFILGKPRCKNEGRT